MLTGLLAIVFFDASGGQAAAAEPVKIANSWIVPVSNIASILFAKDGIARHNGKSYVMDAVHFQGSTPMITALASGDIDIALLGYSSFPLAIENAGLEDARLIADEIQDGAPGYYSQVFVVRKNGPIKTVEDLKGKVVATNAAGSAVDIAMRAMLTRHGIDPKKDVTTIEGAFPNMKALLAEQKVALIPSVLPFSEDPELRAQSEVLFTQRDAMGPSELGIWVARKSFIDKNRAALVDLLEDYLRVVRFYIDPRNHAEAVQIAANFSKLPPAVFDSWLFTRNDYYRDPNGRPNLEALQSNIDLEREEGFIRAPIDIRKYVDLSLIEEAAKRLP
jgi:NitT/TauT family transport system substrate-binding protein